MQLMPLKFFSDIPAVGPYITIYVRESIRKLYVWEMLNYNIIFCNGVALQQSVVQ